MVIGFDDQSLTKPTKLDYAGWADKMAGESFSSEDGFMRIVKHEPIGVRRHLRLERFPHVLCVEGCTCASNR